MRWTNHGTTLKPVEDYYPGDDTEETLQERLNRKPSAEESNINAAALRRAKEIGLENYSVAPSPFADNVGLPGSMLIANSDCGVIKAPARNAGQTLNKRPTPSNPAPRIPATASTPALIKK